MKNEKINRRVGLGVGAVFISAIFLTGCSSFDGQVGKKVETFEDDHGRVCTAMKWGDSSALDCDYKE